MTNKHLKIENLENLYELNAEEVFSIQGGDVPTFYDKDPLKEKLERLKEKFMDKKDEVKEKLCQVLDKLCYEEAPCDCPDEPCHF